MVFFVLLILICFNALYVAAEFGAVSVRRSKIHQEAESGSGLARRLLTYVEDGHNLDRYVATCQIGITISSLVLGAYGQTALSPMLAPLFESWGGMQEFAAQSSAAVTILLVLTGFQMILGELVPKSLALEYPTKVALYTVIPLQWSVRLLSWFIAVLNGSGLAILKVLGVDHTGHMHIHTAKEIEYLIAESKEGGFLDAEEHGRLREALRLGVTAVEEVMVPRTEIIGIPAGVSPEEALRIANANPYSRFPVYEEALDDVVGYIHVQDLVRVALDDTAKLPVRHIVVVPESSNLEQTLQMLRTQRQHVALVVDEYGGTAGLVTIGDILEDIFGGIADEFKPAEPDPVRLSDGSYRLWGAMRLSDAAEFLDADWEGEAVTLGGFVMEQMARVPEVGDEIVVAGVRLTIERMQRRKVKTVLALPLDEDEAEIAEGDDE